MVTGWVSGGPLFETDYVFVDATPAEAATNVAHALANAGFTVESYGPRDGLYPGGLRYDLTLSCAGKRRFVIESMLFDGSTCVTLYTYGSRLAADDVAQRPLTADDAERIANSLSNLAVGLGAAFVSCSYEGEIDELWDREVGVRVVRNVCVRQGFATGGFIRVGVNAELSSVDDLDERWSVSDDWYWFRCAKSGEAVSTEKRTG